MSFSSKLVTSLALVLVACGGSGASSSDTPTTSDPELRSITNAEALSDFDQIAEQFRSLYGAMDRKQAKYNFQFEALVTEYRAKVQAASTEPDYRAIFQEFISRFNDAHVSLYADLDADSTKSLYLHFLVMPVGDSYVVYYASEGVTDPKIGEEVLAIDGVSASDLYTQLAKYQGVPNELARKHFVSENFTYKPGYLSQKIDPNVPAKVTVRAVDGSVRDVNVPWSVLPNLLPAAQQPVAPPQQGRSGPHSLLSASNKSARVTRSELMSFGSRVPFFMTEQVKNALGITGEVTPTPASLVKYGVTAEAAAKINYFAVKYFTNGKKVMLVRIPDYEPEDPTSALGYLKALFEDQTSQVDALIVDETHNPGGSIDFAKNVLSLLGKQPLNGYVQRMHGDRAWIDSYASYASQLKGTDDALASTMQSYAHTVDDAYSNNVSLSAPLPFFDPSAIIQPDAQHWTKPVMLLADELSVSCADIVPLIFKTNAIGPVFGQTTMGGGGNVETVAYLTHTQGALSLSRGVGTVFDPTGAYPEANIIEDNGVAPTIPYSHTLADYRAGYVGYVTTFNKALTTQLP